MPHVGRLEITGTSDSARGRKLHGTPPCCGLHEAVSPGTMMPHRQEESIPSLGAVARAALCDHVAAARGSSRALTDRHTRMSNMAKSATTMAGLTFHRATASRWSDLETLFGERGACGGCWRMAWRMRNNIWPAGQGARNKGAFKKIVMAGERPGVLGYLGKQPIAWCAVAPRETYSFLERSRVLQPLDDEPVWSISCLFVLLGQAPNH